MANRILALLFSTRLMAVLFIVYAAAMAAGTFIESAYNTDTARIWVYNTRWFELILFFFLINFIGNIKRYQLHLRKNWATLLLHLSFIFIIIGAGITRYISYEGMMPIREGESANQFYSDRTFLTVLVDGNYKGELKRRILEKPLILSEAVYPPFASNHFALEERFDTVPFTIEYDSFLMNVKESIKADPKGKLYFKLVEAGNGERHEHYLAEGEVQSIHGLLFAFNKPMEGAINITSDGTNTTLKTPFAGNFMRMADQLKGEVTANTEAALMLRSLYNVGGSQFVFPEPPMRGVKDFVSGGDYKAKNADDALTVKIHTGGKTERVTLVGSKGKTGEPRIIKVGDLEFTLQFGSKVYELPFSMKLNDFIADKYPGTEKSYSAFKSIVTVIDKAKKTDAEIYMNHILDYGGYRFFQSSFDPDEKGTILSVNHDFWGTLITYIGYFLLFFAMLAILFDKNTRFANLKRKLGQLKEQKAALTLLLLFGLSGSLAAQHSDHDGHQHAPAKPQKEVVFNYLDSVKKYAVPEKQAAQFGRLVIQDEGGRMKPVNTFSSELLRKVSKSDTYEGLNADQVFLSMVMYPKAWENLPIIYLKRGNDSIRKLIGVDKDAKYVRFKDFITPEGNYKLSPYLEDAYKTTNPNNFQKDFVEADKKINLLFSAMYGGILKIFPVPNDKGNKWVSFMEINQPTGTDLDKIKNAFPYYLNELGKGATTQNYTMANTLLQGIEDYQKKFGKAVRPSDDQITSEILLNKYDVFRSLFTWYMLAGSLMLILVIVQIFTNNKPLRYAITAFHVIIGLLFATHTLGLIARWYVSGHAPWSDAYESMIYVAWATMFFTLAFDKKSKLTIAAGTFVASMILMVAHMSWMDPQIANLQPVLNSYWLMIHVAVIVASYGPFTLGMILGIVAMFLMLVTTAKNKNAMELHIKEITYINEMALTIGLVLLTIGNFLGGQWANESWGRYWGWDPKETWALISIMVYAFVIHARLVPGLRGLFAFNFMSVLAFASILMTYFGVNFHLTGMHSYATGEKQNVDIYIRIFVVFMVFASFVFWRYRKLYAKPKKA